MKNIFVFDVESESLYGEGFAVGAIVLDSKGNEIDRFEMISKEGALAANDWVTENVLPHCHDLPLCGTKQMLRTHFYAFYMKHKDTCEFWSDVNYPVETNFLAAVVADIPEIRQWNMPYPLKDISTLIPVDIDRNETCGIEGLTKHNPMHDAIASAHCLIKELNKCSPNNTTTN